MNNYNAYNNGHKKGNGVRVVHNIKEPSFRSQRLVSQNGKLQLRYHIDPATLSKARVQNNTNINFMTNTPSKRSKFPKFPKFPKFSKGTKGTKGTRKFRIVRS